jgi:hypothetical protein
MLLKNFYPQNTQVSEAKEFRESYYKYSNAAANFRSVNFSIWCYRGNIVTPKWEDIDTSESHLTNHLFSVLDELIFCR